VFSFLSCFGLVVFVKIAPSLKYMLGSGAPRFFDVFIVSRVECESAQCAAAKCARVAIPVFFDVEHWNS
jgi:hypothetical protein